MAKNKQTIDLRDTPVLEMLALLRPYVLPVLGITFALLVALLTWQRVERFLYEDERFTLRAPAYGAKLSPDLRLSGMQRAQSAAVRGVFRDDEGQSVFRIPLAERQRRIREIKWVRAATVSRVWPNRIDLRVEERTPVAFVQVASYRKDQPARVNLIDDEGELLPVTPGVDYALPVLTGVREDQQVAARGARVKLMRRVLDDLGPYAKSVSEVNVCQENNVRLIYPMEGRAVHLVMGGEMYRARLERFLRYYPEIRKKMPEVIRLDLRLEDRITADQSERVECDGE
ncbi:MAG: FtsQ-type POTRA domain-containing protein [Acidobacteria bacterium]|nr:FtsQ-type POTRA domain-containing protein [Acidobacteriota bacterium]